MCDCAALVPEQLDHIAACGDALRVLVLGRFPPPLLRYARRLLRALPRCEEAHFHDCVETPPQSSFFEDDL